MANMRRSFDPDLDEPIDQPVSDEAKMEAALQDGQSDVSTELDAKVKAQNTGGLERSAFELAVAAKLEKLFSSIESGAFGSVDGSEAISENPEDALISSSQIEQTDQTDSIAAIDEENNQAQEVAFEQRLEAGNVANQSRLEEEVQLEAKADRAVETQEGLDNKKSLSAETAPKVKPKEQSPEVEANNEASIAPSPSPKPTRETDLNEDAFKSLVQKKLPGINKLPKETQERFREITNDTRQHMANEDYKAAFGSFKQGLQLAKDNAGTLLKHQLISNMEQSTLGSMILGLANLTMGVKTPEMPSAPMPTSTGVASHPAGGSQPGVDLNEGASNSVSGVSRLSPQNVQSFQSLSQNRTPKATEVSVPLDQNNPALEETTAAVA